MDRPCHNAFDSTKRRRIRYNTTVGNTSIDDLPDDVLADVLSRLPMEYHISTSCHVCERWRYIINSDLYFRGLFCLRHKQPGPARMLIMNARGHVFQVGCRYVSYPNLLSKIFGEITSVMSLTHEPVVSGVANDLVLCCATASFQRDYFIYNPYSFQWIELPPTSQVLEHVPIGFICDPYYAYVNKDDVGSSIARMESKTIIDDGTKNMVVFNRSYRCVVVRILPPCDDTFNEEQASSVYKLDIFSFEKGEWSESTISFSRSFIYHEINWESCSCHNGMMYWSSKWSTTSRHFFLIGLDPFTSEANTTNANSGTYIELAIEHNYQIDYEFTHYEIKCMNVVKEKCLQVCLLNYDNKSVLLWELKEDNKDVTKLASCRKDQLRIVPPEGEESILGVEFVGFDCKGLLYVKVNRVDESFSYYRIDIRSSQPCEADMTGRVNSSNYFFSIPVKEDLSWLTPLPSFIFVPNL